MATFSRELLRSLAQPAFQESLFTAARNLGMGPGLMELRRQQEAKRLAEEQRQQGITGGLLDLQQAIARGEDASEATGSVLMHSKLLNLLILEKNNEVLILSKREFRFFKNRWQKRLKKRGLQNRRRLQDLQMIWMS